MYMCVLKILEVFLPAAISESGRLCDHMNPPYIGFMAEVVQVKTWEGKSVPTSELLGTKHIIIEKATWEAAAFYKGDYVSVSSTFITQGPYGIECGRLVAQF